MSDLSPEAKALFQDAQRAYAPNEAELRAVQASLAARIAGAGASSGAGLPSAKAVLAKAGLAKVGGPFGLSLAALGLVAAAALGVALHAGRAPQPAAGEPGGAAEAPVAPAPVAPESLPDAAGEVPFAAAWHGAAEVPPKLPGAKSHAAPARADLGRGHKHSATVAGPSTVGREEASPSVGTTTPTEPPRAPTEGDSLASEISLLRGARGALDRGDAARALILLDEHAATFPEGTLKEERLATRVLALCGAGRVDDAKAAARAFQRKAPRSPHLGRLRASCAGPALEDGAARSAE